MARNPRDMNELEGTLLPVLATAVPVQNDTLPPHSVAEATLIPIPPPVSSTTTTATTAPAPVAPVLRTYDDNSPQDQEREVSNKTFEGSHVGRINALTENKHIRKENRKAMLHNRNEAQSIGLGNQIAKQRDREGFDSRNYRVEEEALRQQNKQREEEAKRIKDAGKGKDDGANGVTKEEGGGYQCEEYNMTTYDGMEYESNYEYKSVYD